MANKFSLDFQGFLDFAYKIEELGGSEALKKATDNALKATDRYVTKEVDNAVAKSKFNFDRTGRTKSSLDKEIKTEWDGTVGKATAGFHITQGGLASQFLIYGTPHIAGDTNLRNAVRGEGKHRKIIRQLQQEEFSKVLNEVMRND